jgi:hypothetical protein
MSTDQNIARAKKGYAAGNSTISGTYHGKAELGQMLMKLAEKSVTARSSKPRSSASTS